MTLFEKLIILLAVIIGIILIVFLKKKFDQWAIDRAMRPYVIEEMKKKEVAESNG